MFRKPIHILLFVIWLAVTLWCLPGFVERFTHGHEGGNYGSYVVWGLWVSAYIYFMGLSAGAFLFSSLVYVAGLRQLERLGRLALFVAIVTLGMALVSIWFDLGRMERSYRVFTDPNFSSMMAWMIWLYTAYFLVLLIEFWLASRPALAQWSVLPGLRGVIGRTLSLSKGPLTEAQRAASASWLRTFACVGIPLAISFNGGVGALFGTLSGRPYWHTPLMPILFLTGALVSGGGLMTFLVAACWPERDRSHARSVSFLGSVVLGLLIFDILLEWAEFSIPMWYGVGHEYDLLMRILFGEYWWVFWIVHIGLGTLIPLLLLTFRSKSVAAVGLAGLLIAVTFMAVRVNLVVPGLAEPNLLGLEQAYVHPRLSFEYVPSLFEWQVTLFISSCGIAAMFLGLKLLPLTTSPESQAASGSGVSLGIKM